MTIYRLCNKDEAEFILKNGNFKDIGHSCEKDFAKNTHQYIQDKKYMHFFEDELSLLHLYPSKGKMICVYQVPDDILEAAKGKGLYLDFINFENMQKVDEYAIESDKMKFEYLEKIYTIDEDLDFDYIPHKDELYDALSCIYDFNSWKKKIEECLTGNNIVSSINENVMYLVTLIPEMKHTLEDIKSWKHTLEILQRLNIQDLELNMAILLQNIKSDETIGNILNRLGYGKEVIERITYLTQDKEITNFDNNPEIFNKKLLLQSDKAYCLKKQKLECDKNIDMR